MDYLKADNLEIRKIVTSYRKSKIQSEAEVRSKLIAPLLEAMGYLPEYRAEEFPVYGYDGQKKLSAKNADYILFDDTGFADHRNRTQSHIKWVQNHSLLVVEAKKPGKMPDELGQAQFYTMWTKAPAYIETDGEDVLGYFYNPIVEDYEMLKVKIDDLPSSDLLQSFSFESLKKVKSDGLHALQAINKQLRTQIVYQEETMEEDINLPAEAIAFYRGLLGKNADHLTDMQVICRFLNMTNAILQNDFRYDIPPYMLSIPRYHYNGKLYIDNMVFPLISGEVLEFYWNDVTRYQFESQYIQIIVQYVNDVLTAFEVGYHVLDRQVAERISNFALVKKCLQAQTIQIVIENAAGRMITLPAGDPGDMWTSKKHVCQMQDFWLEGLNKMRAIEEYYNIEFKLRYLANPEEIEEMLDAVDVVYDGICMQQNCEITLPGNLLEEDLIVEEPMLFQENTRIPLKDRVIHGIIFRPLRSAFLPCKAAFAGKNENDIVRIPGCCEYQIIN